MTKRIDIELTARSGEDAWAWRVVDAKQPRGKLPASIIPSDSAVGDVLHAEIESGLDGIEVVSAVKAEPPDDGKSDSNRIVVLGTQRRHKQEYQDYTETIDTAGDHDGQAAPPDGYRHVGARDKTSSRKAGSRRDTLSGPRKSGTDASTPKHRHDQAGTKPTSTAARTGGSAADRGDMGRRHDPIRRALSTRYRDAALANLRPEQLPIAEELLRGGIPAVRKQIDRQIAIAKRNNAPLIAVDPLLAMAEELLPIVNLAHWKDRAVTARSLGSDIPLYELRSIVSASSNVDLDEEASDMAAALKEALHARIEALRIRWEGQIDNKISKGNVIEALKLSSSPPDRSFKLPSELAVRLSAAAGTALSSDKAEEEWLEIIDAVVTSPVRRNVKPVALPEKAGNELRSRLYKYAGLIPETSKLIGLPMPPPPTAVKS